MELECVYIYLGVTVRKKIKSNYTVHCCKTHGMKQNNSYSGDNDTCKDLQIN